MILLALFTVCIASKYAHSNYDNNQQQQQQHLCGGGWWLVVGGWCVWIVYMHVCMNGCDDFNGIKMGLAHDCSQ
jgi:hypothetical protein